MGNIYIYINQFETTVTPHNHNVAWTNWKHSVVQLSQDARDKTNHIKIALAVTQSPAGKYLATLVWVWIIFLDLPEGRAAMEICLFYWLGRCLRVSWAKLTPLRLFFKHGLCCLNHLCYVCLGSNHLFGQLLSVYARKSRVNKEPVVFLTMFINRQDFCWNLEAHKVHISTPSLSPALSSPVRI